MKKISIILLLLALLLTAANAEAKKKGQCAKISDSVLLYEPLGDPALPETDQWGYNYQAHRFEGPFCNHIPYFREGNPGHEACMRKYANDKLTIKWNDAWLSNRDCDGDEILDRHFGFERYVGSGAWYTTKLEREYDYAGKTCKLSHFMKLAAPPEGSKYEESGIWYDENGKELGNVYRGMLLVKEVKHDPCKGFKGSIKDDFMTNDGLGSWK